MSDVAGMPTLRAWTNRFMAFILHGLVKVYIPDPPCGFRFYRSDVLPYILSDEPRFAFEFDVLIRAAKRRIRMDSVRISTRYAPDQKSHVEADSRWMAPRARDPKTIFYFDVGKDF